MVNVRDKVCGIAQISTKHRLLWQQHALNVYVLLHHCLQLGALEPFKGSSKTSQSCQDAESDYSLQNGTGFRKQWDDPRRCRTGYEPKYWGRDELVVSVIHQTHIRSVVCNPFGSTSIPFSSTRRRFFFRSVGSLGISTWSEMYSPSDRLTNCSSTLSTPSSATFASSLTLESVYNSPRETYEVDWEYVWGFANRGIMDKNQVSFRTWWLLSAPVQRQTLTRRIKLFISLMGQEDISPIW